MTADEDPPPDAVEQSGKPLETVNRGEWRLSRFTGQVSVSFRDGDSIDIPLFNRRPMIFKLSNDWTGDGRQIRAMTKGHFIVIAPCEWMRERERHESGEPERCSDTRFAAHFFFRDGNEPDEDSGGFAGHEVALTASGFELDGDSLFDDSREGDLFVGEPPLFKAAQSVVWARVGEERPDGWRGENFKPAKTELADVLAGRQGRFYIRVYDTEARLLDSGQFRYLSDLQRIMVDEAPYTRDTLLLPPPLGHPPTSVRFAGADGAALAPILPSDAPRAASVEGGVAVEPDPDADDFSCALETDAGRVDIVLELPRVWWRLEQDCDEADEAWRDGEMTMTRQEFREGVDRNAVVRMRVPKRVKSVRVGFGDDVARAYPSKRHHPRGSSDAHSRSYVRIPLADFADYTQIDQWLADDALFNARFDLSGREPKPKPVSPIRVQADPTPEIVLFRSGEQAVAAGDPVTLYWTTRNTERIRVALEPGNGNVEPNGELQITPSETTSYTLRLTAPGMDDITKRLTVKVHPQRHEVLDLTARVKRPVGGWRKGRGFSHEELRAAGLTASEARRRSIRVDERRRSSHPMNVETLGRLSVA